MKFKIAIFLLIIKINTVFAQYGLPNFIINKNDLPSTYIYSSYFDSNGQMWFSTDKGLSSYNSNSFKTYNINDGLSDNEVFSVFEDNKSRIWITTLSGEFAYVFKNKLYYAKTDSSLKKLNSLVDKNKYYLRHVSQLNNDTIYFFLKSNSYYKYFNHGKYLKCKIKNLSTHTYHLFYYKNILYAITNYGIIDFYKEKIITPFQFDEMSNKSFKKLNEEIYFFKRNEIYKVKNTQIQKIFTFRENILIKNFEFLDFENIVFYSNDTLYRYHTKTKIYSVLNIPNNTNLSSLNKDAEKNLWITSLNYGAFFIPYNTLNYNVNNPTKNITSLLVNNNDVFYGDINGILYWLNLTTNEEKIFYTPPEFTERLPLNPIKSMVIDKNNILWIGYGSKLVKYNLINNNITKHETNVKNIELDVNKEAWITSFYGVTKADALEIKSNSFTYFKDSVFRIYRFYGFCQDADNKNYYMSHDNIFITYKNKVIRQDTLNNKINLIKTKNNKLFWILNQDNGLWVYNKINFKKIPISNLEGLPIVCNDMYLQNDTTIWVCYKNQFSKIEVSEKNRILKKQIKYNLDQNTIINSIKYNEGIIYFATESGLIRIHETDLKTEKYDVPIQITSISINDKMVEPVLVYNLSHKQNNIVINYNAKYFQKFGDVNYRYKFMGNDTNWHYTKVTSLEFPNLPSGNYHFKINPSDKYGYWSKHTINVYFNISTPFYKTWWFIIILFITIILIISLFTINILKRNNLKKEIEISLKQSLLLEREKTLILQQKQQDAEQKLYSAQVNPHFIFNSLNSIQGFVLKNNPREAYNYIEIFSKLIRSVLVNSKKYTIPIIEDIENLKKYLELEKLRFLDKLKYEFIFENEVPEYKNMPSMLLQPYIENAIWHGIMPKKTTGILKIYYKFEDDYVKIKIIDDGIGRKLAATYPKKNKGTGSGLKLCEERLRLYTEKIHKTYTIEIVDLYQNEIACGTEINLKIPLI